jgi:hypothetical protein
LSKEKIGATGIIWKLLPKELSEISEKFKAGKPISSIEIQKLRLNWQSEDPLIDENGNPFVFYIHDFSNSHWGTPNRVFHVSWCSTLEKMEKGGRKERYVKKSDLENNDFRVDYGGNRKGVEHLPACWICKDHMQNKIAPKELYYDRTNLDILKFFQMYGKQHLRNMDNPMHPVGYPENWKQLSKRIQEEANWICSKCRKSFAYNQSYLDVHHKNGITSDTRTDNLTVLCKKCHGEEFAHGHYKSALKNPKKYQSFVQKNERVVPASASRSQMNVLENFLSQPEKYATGTERSIQKVTEIRESFEIMKGGLSKERQAAFHSALGQYERKLKSLR